MQQRNPQGRARTHGVICALGIAALLCGAAKQMAGGEDGEDDRPFPEYHGDVPLADRLSTVKIGDLTGNIPADRPLTLQELDYILRLSDYLIDKQNDWSSRDAAANILGDLGHQYAIPALLAVLRDEKDNSEVRQRVVAALSKIRDKRVIGWLIEDALGSGENRLAMQALEDLPQLVGGPNVQEGFDLMPPPPSDNLEAYRKENAKYLQKFYQHAQKAWRAWWKENRDRIDNAKLGRGGQWAY